MVEDNPYGLLRFAGEPVPTLLSMDTSDNIVYLGSFSKIISPGIRTGYIIAPPAIYQKTVFGKQATDLCSSPLNQLFVHEFISSGAWKDYVLRQRVLYLSRRDAMLADLQQGLVLFRKLEQRVSLGQINGHGLFQQYMTSRLESRQGEIEFGGLQGLQHFLRDGGIE